MNSVKRYAAFRRRHRNEVQRRWDRRAETCEHLRALARSQHLALAVVAAPLTGRFQGEPSLRDCREHCLMSVSARDRQRIEDALHERQARIDTLTLSLYPERAALSLEDLLR